MSYCCGGGCQGGYASSESSSGYASQSEEGGATYSSQTKRQSFKMIGCTCGGKSACRGTCRMPVPE